MLARPVRDEALAVLDARILLGDPADAREGAELLVDAVDQVLVVTIAEGNPPLIHRGVHALPGAQPLALGLGQGTLRIPRVAIDPAPLVGDGDPCLPMVVLAGEGIGSEPVIGLQKMADSPVERAAVCATGGANGQS